MPSSRWASQRFDHLMANSVSSSSRGIKLAAKAVCRPLVLVPTRLSDGISTSPSGSWATMFTPFRISSSTARYGDWPRATQAR